uniref:Putative secreted protein n=1 Tax=Ixodes ricinus TaxID=34613 RepID=A0A6B0UK25_IXORI
MHLVALELVLELALALTALGVQSQYLFLGHLPEVGYEVNRLLCILIGLLQQRAQFAETLEQGVHVQVGVLSGQLGCRAPGDIASGAGQSRILLRKLREALLETLYGGAVLHA